MFDTNKIDNKFIIVYDKLTAPIAQSCFNRAVSKGIQSVTWSKKDYLGNKVKLSNNNYVLLLDESIIKVNLADSALESHEIIPGVLYKHQGHQLGLFVDTESEAFIKSPYKYKVKDGLQFLIALVGCGGVGLAIWTFRFLNNKKKKMKFCLLMKSLDQFEKEYLLKYVHGEL